MTCLKYMILVGDNILQQLRRTLPDNFGIIFDGWTTGNGHHLLAVFAVFHDNTAETDNVATCLLSCSQLSSEGDFTAVAHYKYLQTILQMYGKSLDSVDFLTGDNCSVNRALVAQIGECFFVSSKLQRFMCIIIVDTNDIVHRSSADRLQSSI